MILVSRFTSLRIRRRLAALGCVAAMAAGTAGLRAAPAAIGYNDQIQPILAENCFSCHGPDSATRKGKLRLDRFEFATAKRDDLPAITPGHPEQSALVERILSTDDEERMPPRDSHKTLKPEEIALLKRWVEQGAKYQEHWSLIAPVRPAVPALRGAAARWGRNPIDAFVAQSLDAAGLKPGREENPARLLRRVTFDLTGLPPTPDEIAAFQRDPSPAAYDRVVDRLLASDACAEHFARQWLDAIRYADTHGIHIDNYRSIWPYRDWVVDAYRRNLPFDRFTIEQMAGDLLPEAGLDQKVASGFNRCLATTSEGGAIAAEYEAIYAKDRVETMSTVWLGLTTGCASCHDHKFDPVTTRDFYALAAFFRNNTMPAMDGNVMDTPPTVFVPAAGDRARWDALQSEIAAAKAAAQERMAAGQDAYQAWLSSAPPLAAPPLDRRVKHHIPLTEADGPIVRGVPPDAGSSEPDRVAGVYGPAPKINDLDLVLGSPVPITREGAVSFGLLVRVDGKPTGPLLSCLTEDGTESGWEVFFEDGKIGLVMIDAAAGITARGTARDAMTPGRWHHVLFSYDAAGMRSRNVDVFVDGNSVANSGEVSRFPHDLEPAAPLRLGARHGADGKAAAGLKRGSVWVQDIREYDRGFQQAEAKILGQGVEAHTALAVAADKRTAAQQRALRDYFFTTVDAPGVALAAKLDGLLGEDEALRRRGGITLVMEEKKGSEPEAAILKRGDYTQPGEKVKAAPPAVLPPFAPEWPRNRLGLAYWLVDAKNPLTARVTVNRAWQSVFGTGLVETAGDFGVTGARPSHPALLDWLAVEFRETGWDYRRLMRLLVTSATYRQSAALTPALLERDPANRLLARGPRYRLDAEELRDQALAASGLLVAKLGGAPVRPYQPDGIWEDVAMKQSTTRFYHMDSGEKLYRRSLYTLWKRTAPPPAMDILNAPSREVSCVRRDRTNTPLQALVTLNEPLFVEAARQLASRALEGATTFDARVDALSSRLLSRTLARPERAVVRRTLDAALATYRKDPAAVQALLTVGESPVTGRVDRSELAAWTIVASELMNLDDALTK